MPALGLGLGFGLGGGPFKKRSTDPLAGIPLSLRLQTVSGFGATPQAALGLYSDVSVTVPAIDADPLAAWVDKLSGNGLAATQSTLADRPRYSGYSYFRAVGASQCLKTTQVITSQTFTIFVVAAWEFLVTSADGYHALIGFTGPGGVDGGALFVKENNTSAFYLLNNSGGSFDSYDGTGALTYTPSTKQRVFEIVSDGANLSVYCDGVLDKTISVGASFFIDGTLTIALGVSTAPSRIWDGPIKAVLVSQSALSSAQRTTVRNFLTSKIVSTTQFYFPTWNNQTTGALIGVIADTDLDIGYTIPTTFTPASVIGTGDYSPLTYGGKYWLAYSNTRIFLSNTQNFGLAYSTDLQTWTEVTPVDCSGAPSPNYGFGGPEFFVDSDGSVHVIVDGYDIAGTAFQFVETHPLTADLAGAWSTPVAVTWTSQPTKIIDPFPIKVSGVYYLLYKDDTTKNICWATATTLLGPYTQQGILFNGYEGPGLTLSPLGNWRITMDQYPGSGGGNGLFFSDSSSPVLATALAGSWSTPAQVNFLGVSTPHHCSPLAVVL